MEAWLEWARGPFFYFALAFCALGLLRHIALTVWQIAQAVHRAGNKVMPYSAVIKATAQWLLPIRKVGDRPLYSATTVAFHVSIIVVPLFLAGHAVLISRGLTIPWPSLPAHLADVLTVIAIVTAVALPIERFAKRDSRGLSTFLDYAIPLVIAVPFVSGMMLAHPTISSVEFETIFFVHVVSANIVLILLPITKLRHCVLMPTGQVISEVAWHFPPDAGAKLAAALGKEDEPV